MLHTKLLSGTFLLVAIAALAAGCGDATKSTGSGPAGDQDKSTVAKVGDAMKDGMETAGAVAKDGLEKAGDLAGEAGAAAEETGKEVAAVTKKTVHELATDLAEATKPAAEAVANLAAEFSLPDTNGKTHALSDYRGKYVVLEWTNHGCPYVKKHYGAGNMQALQKKYTAKDVVWLSICSSAEGKQGYHAAADWQQVMEKHGSAPTAVLLDPAGTVGRLYEAKTTPHMFVIGTKGEVLYQGAIDSDSSADPKTIATATNYVAATLDAAMAGEPVTTAKTKPYG